MWIAVDFSTGCPGLQTSPPLVRLFFGWYRDAMSSPQFTYRRTKVRPRFPNAIREYRLRAGLTQARLARMLGKTRGIVSSWECGHVLPTVPNLFRLAKTLGTLAESLYIALYCIRPPEENQANATNR